MYIQHKFNTEQLIGIIMGERGRTERRQAFGSAQHAWSQELLYKKNSGGYVLHKKVEHESLNSSSIEPR
jgi:hypothetical protein